MAAFVNEELSSGFAGKEIVIHQEQSLRKNFRHRLDLEDSIVSGSSLGSYPAGSGHVSSIASSASTGSYDKLNSVHGSFSEVEGKKPTLRPVVLFQHGAYWPGLYNHGKSFSRDVAFGLQPIGAAGYVKSSDRFAAAMPPPQPASSTTSGAASNRGKRKRLLRTNFRNTTLLDLEDVIESPSSCEEVVQKPDRTSVDDSKPEEDDNDNGNRESLARRYAAREARWKAKRYAEQERIWKEILPQVLASDAKKPVDDMASASSEEDGERSVQQASETLFKTSGEDKEGGESWQSEVDYEEYRVW